MSNQRISAKEFFDAFQDEWARLCEQEKFDGTTPFRDKAEWTHRMLKQGGFLHGVMNRLRSGDRHLEYRTEWYYVDALYVGGEDTYRDKLTYPSEVHALIEHEFEDSVETEMWKLIHWRAPLKVLINYDWADDEKTTDLRRNYASDKSAKFRKMLSSVNDFHPEAPHTEYLFLMASRTTQDGPIIWRRL